MNELRQYTPLDRLILRLDERLFPKSRPKSRPNRTDARNNPAADMVSPLQEPAARVAAGLMRVNHAGEVCAQALYQGQALAARDPRVRERLQESAREEEDHLDWCRERLQELHAHASHLNPLWYLGSFSIGLLAGVAGDRWSLGFLAETEQQVTRHLQSHLQRLPEADTRSRAIIEQMIIDESRHADVAIEAGAARLPEPIRHLMAVGSKVMTGTAYYL